MLRVRTRVCAKFKVRGSVKKVKDKVGVRVKGRVMAGVKINIDVMVKIKLIVKGRGQG